MSWSFNIVILKSVIVIIGLFFLGTIHCIKMCKKKVLIFIQI